MRVILLGVVLAIAAAAPANSFADDKQIAEFIKAKLVQEKQRGNLFGFNVDMRVDRGTVWFKGFVSNRNQELMILRTAQLAGHLGVSQVVDDIEINQPGQPVAQQQQPLAPQPQQAVQPRQSVMTGTQNPYQMLQPQGAAQDYGQQQAYGQQQQAYGQQQQQAYGQQLQAYGQQQLQQQLLQRGAQAMPQMPLPRANVPSAPARHAAPMSMPVSKLENDEEGDTQKVAYQEAVENDTRYVSPFAGGRPQSPFNSGYGFYNTDSQSDPSFQDSLSKTVPASAAVPARAPVTAPAAGAPLPFARAVAAAPAPAPTNNCQGGICGSGFAGGGLGGGGFGGGGFAGGGGFGGALPPGGGFAGGGGGGGAALGGSANLPGYAWPSYAAHPNYGAVSYPKQYSPSAWPYIGPFYPYPQVPLGWRRVALEWDDGWWHLDFYDKNSSSR